LLGGSTRTQTFENETSIAPTLSKQRERERERCKVEGYFPGAGDDGEMEELRYIYVSHREEEAC